jgi:hypothetical protein
VIEGVHQSQTLVEVTLRRRLVGRYRIGEVAERGEQRRHVTGIDPGSIGQQLGDLHPSLERRVALVRGHPADRSEQVGRHEIPAGGLRSRCGGGRPRNLLRSLLASAVIVTESGRGERGQAQRGTGNERPKHRHPPRPPR